MNLKCAIHARFKANTSLTYNIGGLVWATQLMRFKKVTLDNTAKLIQTLQAETREYMCEHYRTRLWALGPSRIDDVYTLIRSFHLYAQLEDTNASKSLYLSIQNLKEFISYGGMQITLKRTMIPLDLLGIPTKLLRIMQQYLPI